MAHIVGCVTTTHVPSIGGAIAKHKESDPYWSPFFDGFKPVHQWLQKVKPDIAVVIYNDHGLNFFLDKLPTFAVGAAAEYRHADEGWGLPVVAPFKGDEDLSWQIINTLVEKEFDITTCQEMLVDHAFTIPMNLLWPGGGTPPVRAVPICINTVQFPIPSARRSFKLGEAIGSAIEAWDSDAKVLIMGTGGLSHQLDGERAGFMNKEFDQVFMDSLLNQPDWATQYSSNELVELVGSQGVELLNWLAARAATPGHVRKVHSNYHIPISNTASGMMALETVQ